MFCFQDILFKKCKMYFRRIRIVYVILSTVCLLYFILKISKWTDNRVFSTGIEIKDSERRGVVVSLDTDSVKRGVVAALDPPLILYNRVHKCGSKTTLAYLRALRKRNKFHVVYDQMHYEKRPSDTRQRAFVRKVSSLRTPLIYMKHIHFIDFKKFGYDEPVYFNLIRDPVDRMTSHYYYDRTVHRRYIISRVGRKNYNKTINECVEQRLDECVNPFSNRTHKLWAITPYFCGQAAVCRYPSTEAVELAKKNVETHFAVVGYLEDFFAFISVLETVFPTYFTGLKALYKNREQRHENPTRDKYGHAIRLEPVTEKTRQTLQPLLHFEYDFYHFIKQRFKILAHQLNIESKD